MRVGFAGLGAIGWPMAAHLARAHSLTVWNRTLARAEAFTLAHPAKVAPSPKQLAVAADFVVTCLPTSHEVEAVVNQPDGLLQGFRAGSLLIDCTSGDASTSRRLAAQLQGHGVGFLDAPVSGGTNGAEAGTLTIMVGGDSRLFARARPILEAFGRRIEHLGPVGAGHAMKAVNNALLAVNILAFAEGLAALVKSGVPAAKAVAVLNASSGRSFVSEHLVPERVLTGAWPRTFRLALLEKDVRIAVDLLRETAVRGPVLELVGRLFREAHAALGEEADYLEVIKLTELQAGVEIRAGKDEE